MKKTIKPEGGEINGYIKHFRHCFNQACRNCRSGSAAHHGQPRCSACRARSVRRLASRKACTQQGRLVTRLLAALTALLVLVIAGAGFAVPAQADEGSDLISPSSTRMSVNPGPGFATYARSQELMKHLKVNKIVYHQSTRTIDISYNYEEFDWGYGPSTIVRGNTAFNLYRSDGCQVQENYDQKYGQQTRSIVPNCGFLFDPTTSQFQTVLTFIVPSSAGLTTSVQFTIDYVFPGFTGDLSGWQPTASGLVQPDGVVAPPPVPLMPCVTNSDGSKTCGTLVSSGNSPSNTCVIDAKGAKACGLPDCSANSALSGGALCADPDADRALCKFDIGDIGKSVWDCLQSYFVPTNPQKRIEDLVHSSSTRMPFGFITWITDLVNEASAGKDRDTSETALFTVNLFGVDHQFQVFGVNGLAGFLIAEKVRAIVSPLAVIAIWGGFVLGVARRSSGVFGK